MLQYLKIRNLALLNEVALELEEGFHVVTGETGAGKSILLGALALLSGGKADKSAIRQGEDECELEAVLFFPEEHRIHRGLDGLGLPPCEEGALLIQRSISRRKAGRISINGKMTTQANLQALGELWIDFHGPGEPQKLFRQETQQLLLDRFGELDSEVELYQKSYYAWRNATRELARIRSQDRLSEREIKQLREEVKGLEGLSLTEESVSGLEAEFERFQQASELQRLAGGMSDGLVGSSGMLSDLRAVLQLARELMALDPRREEWEKRIEAALVDLEDLSTDIRYAGGDYEWEDFSAQELQERMNHWLRAKRRHGPEVEQVAKALEGMREKLDLQVNLEGILIQKEHEVGALLETLKEEGAKLDGARGKALRKLEKAVNPLLARLGFKKARFEVRLECLDQPELQGASAPRFYFSANPGQEPLPLDRIASSGEIARVMLALKTLLAGVDDTPVLVFDEVDANVGGEIGAVVGEQLAGLAERHQVFCITHLPQVAAQGSHHWLVEKSAGEDETEVSISSLTARGQEARVEELARMLGDRKSKSARTHAEALLVAG